VSDEIAFTRAEHAFFKGLEDLGVPYLIVGLSAALLEGAPVVTQDIDVWFGAHAPWDKVADAAKRAGGFHSAGVLLQRPTLGGPGLDRIDVVLSPQGLGSFADEYASSVHYELQGLHVKALRLERILLSKRAAGRLKDLASVPAVEDALAARRTKRSEQ
jgi:hypothetical protein